MEPGQVIHPNSSSDAPDSAPAQPPASPIPPPPPVNTLLEAAPPIPQINPSPAPSPAPSSPQEPNPEPVDDPDQPDPEQLENAAAQAPQFEWRASEYVHHEHSAGWYGVLALGTLSLMAIAVLLLKEWLSAAVLALMAAAVVVYAHREPGELTYSLSAAGITIAQKFYPYTEFSNFAVVPHKAFLTVELDPLRRFMPRLAIFFDPKDEATVTGILEDHLPRNDRQPDTIDRLSQYLKF